MNPILEKARSIAASMKPCVARHPKTGKWFAIDAVMQWPVGRPCDSKAEAEIEWREFKAVSMADRAGQKAAIMAGNY